MPRRKLLLVDPTATEPAERAKAAALSRRGWDVLVLTPTRVREGTRISECAPLDKHAPYRLMTGDVVGKPPNRNIFINGLVEALLSQPDVVHVLSDENFAMCAQALTLARQLAPRAIRVAHSWQNIVTTWTRHGQPLKLLYALDSGVEAAVFRLAHGIVARNDEVVDVLRQRGYRGAVEHIPWGVDVESVRRAASEAVVFPDGLRVMNRPWIGFVGRLVVEKGVDVLLRAVAKMPMGSAVLVGDGPEMKRLRQLTDELGLDGRVYFAGGVPRAQVGAWLKGIDVLALPSRETAGWKEQFGRVLVESMAVGTPCVGSDSGAIPSVIGPCGETFRVDDVDDLHRALTTVLKDRDAYVRYCAPRADTYSWDAFAERTTTFLDGLMR